MGQQYTQEMRKRPESKTLGLTYSDQRTDFYSSCMKMTQDIFTGGNNIVWVGSELLGNVYSLASLHIIKSDRGCLMKCGSWERGVYWFYPQEDICHLEQTLEESMSP